MLCLAIKKKVYWNKDGNICENIIHNYNKIDSTEVQKVK